ncbi:MAG: FadR/GntR family transcriptional regulator [Vicinamibacterales bacterium]
MSIDTQNREPNGRAAQTVVLHVRRMIDAGKLKIGERLPPERELVRELGVSRTSVRAGLQALAGKGVLKTRRGAGTFVADGRPVLDTDALSVLATLHGFSRAEMFEARRTLEVGVAGLAAERATPEDIAAIADAVSFMFSSVDDSQTFLVSDIRFHRAVADASRNKILASLVETVSALFYERRRRTAHRQVDLKGSAGIHFGIYQAIRDKKRPLAERLMSEHLLVAERDQLLEGPDDGEESEPVGVPSTSDPSSSDSSSY